MLSSVNVRYIIIYLSVFLLVFSLSYLRRSNVGPFQQSSLLLQRRYSTKRQKGQRVVILAGPHKTSSSSIQLNLYRWIHASSRGEMDISGLSKDWAWPAPVQAWNMSGCELNDVMTSKMFYQYVDFLKGKRKNRCILSEYSTKSALDLFSNEFQKKWSDGYSLIIASEAFDFIMSERRVNASEILVNAVSHLPWHQNNTLNGSDHDVTFVVCYRTRRVDHLISLWHQCCMEQMSFYQYLTQRLAHVVDPVRSLDSLKLAKIFLDFNFHTILIDMSGVEEYGYDMSYVVACDVLDANCTEEKRFTDSNGIESVFANVKNHSQTDLNVTKSQLRLINKVIEAYDCNFGSILKHKKLKVLYPNALTRILRKCQENKDPIHSRVEMVEQIIHIAKYGHIKS